MLDLQKSLIYWGCEESSGTGTTVLFTQALPSDSHCASWAFPLQGVRVNTVHSTWLCNRNTARLPHSAAVCTISLELHFVIWSVKLKWVTWISNAIQWEFHYHPCCVEPLIKSWCSSISELSSYFCKGYCMCTWYYTSSVPCLDSCVDWVAWSLLMLEPCKFSTCRWANTGRSKCF